MHSLKKYTCIGIFFVLITGTLLHFVYDWSGRCLLLGLIAPVNESTWEHMKLIFFPMSVYAVFMNRRLKGTQPCVTNALLRGILTGTFLIPVVFYTYSGVIGRNFLVLDIAVFVMNCLAAFSAVYKQTACVLPEQRTRIPIRCSALLPAILVFVLMICFFIFSYYPPKLGLFLPPAAE